MRAGRPTRFPRTLSSSEDSPGELHAEASATIFTVAGCLLATRHDVAGQRVYTRIRTAFNIYGDVGMMGMTKCTWRSRDIQTGAKKCFIPHFEHAS